MLSTLIGKQLVFMCTLVSLGSVVSVLQVLPFSQELLALFNARYIANCKRCVSCSSMESDVLFLSRAPDDDRQ